MTDTGASGSGAGAMGLEGRGALVTGASGGIGGAIARALHAQGATVGLHGTRAERLEELAGEPCGAPSRS